MSDIELNRPEYRHVFSGGAIECVLDPLNRIAIKPSHIQGFWHFERLFGGMSESTQPAKPMRQDAISYPLMHWGFPSESTTAWTRKSDPDWYLNEPSRKHRSPKRNVVYFLRAGPFIKIGFTSRLIQTRIDQLKTGCPYRIEHLASIPGDLNTEYYIHQRFSTHRANLEWFHATDELLAFIQERANAA